MRFVTLNELSLAIGNLKKIIVSALTGLSDFPKSYSGKYKKIVRVNQTETGVEFGPRIFVSDSPPSAGDGEVGDFWIEH